MFRLLIIVLLVTGCATAPKESAATVEKTAPSQDSQFAARNQGYSLLYKLVSDEKNVSKLLLVKKEQSDVGDLIRKISAAAADATKQLDAFAKADGRLHFNMDGLPVAEQETRELIGKSRTKELITKTGEKFELRVLLTQVEALSYGAHLAVVVQSHETDETRRQFLAETSQKFQDLHQAIIDLMHARWQMPVKR